MNKYKIISVALAFLIVAAGLVYMAVGEDSVGIILTVCAASCAAMGIVKAVEVKKCEKLSLPALIPSVCLFILALFVVFAAIYWFVIYK